MFKSVREATYALLGCLSVWQPSFEEIKQHRLLGNDNLPDINWNKRLKAIHSCKFITAKYKQLIYWITTDSLPCGSKIHHYSDRGKCPHCGHVASAEHIFKTCPVSQAYWEIVDKLGTLQYDQYTPYDYNEIPVLLSTHTPVNVFQISALWAIWRVWSSYFFDREFSLLNMPHLEDIWIKQALDYFKAEFTKRIYELVSTVQWLQVSKRRGTVPEKQFLLVDCNKINPNPDTIPVDIKGDLTSEFNVWIGKAYLIAVERHYHKARLKINYAVWAEHQLPQGVGNPQPQAPYGPGFIVPT